jgi:dolichol-phosphate mannosyltransferase
LADKKVIDIINSLSEHNKFLRGLFSWVGFRQVPLEYERKKRFAGKTKYPLKKMLKLAKNGILSFSTKPLKIIGGLGVFSMFISLLILVYSICSYTFAWNSLTPGWASLMVTITFFTGIQLLSIWVMSEYIGKIFEETKRRPEYIISEKINIE